MHRRTPEIGWRYLLNLTLAAVLLSLPTGCGEDTDMVRVDFSNRIHLHDSTAAVSGNPLIVAVAAMVSPDETVRHYRQLLNHIGAGLGTEVRLIQRKTYAEINALLGEGQIDLAFICSGPYASARERFGFEALAVPQVRQKTVYRSYLIVNKNNPIDRLADLRDKVFAFTDPDSNTGCMVPSYLLGLNGETPESFFEKTIYTHSHDNSIMAVARNLVDGAFVHEQIWEYYQQKNPFYTAQTRVIFRSEPFGNPPLVASASLPVWQKNQIRALLLQLHTDPRGAALLDELLIDRFVPVDERLYDPIRRMQAQLQLRELENVAASKP